jgi:D-3-phosphoglycerate dehydrogenase
MIGARELGLMKQGALLINVARGPVVVEADLIAALATGHLGGAALDVFSTQPLAADHPLLGFDNVILTPHLAGITDEAMERMGTVVAEETIRVLAGKLPVNLVNPEAVSSYRQRFPA